MDLVALVIAGALLIISVVLLYLWRKKEKPAPTQEQLIQEQEND